MADINVTPLVDVMLVLLIIFMVTAPLLTAGVPVDLPESRANAIQQEPDQVVVSIAPDGQVYIDDQPVSLDGLATALANVPRDAQGRPPLVTLRADKVLQYGQVMAVMGELNRAGFNSISMITSPTVQAEAVNPGSDEQP
jgi:biopolymer transport protein TolR